MQWLRLNKISIFYCLVKDSKCNSLCCCWQCVVAKMENYNDDRVTWCRWFTLRYQGFYLLLLLCYCHQHQHGEKGNNIPVLLL